jgi:LEA14-like dessication related protein
VTQGTVLASEPAHPRREIRSSGIRLEVYIRRVWSITALAGLACAGLGDNFKEPEVRLEQAVVRGLGLAGGNLDLIVRIQNPNNFTLQADKLQVGIDVEGSHLGDITYQDDFAVTQNGETTLTLPLRFGWFGVGSAVRAALGYGDLPYTLKGQATLKLPGGAHTVVSFSHEGRAPLTRSTNSVGST